MTQQVLLICVLNSLRQSRSSGSPGGLLARIDGAIEPNLPPGAQIGDPEFIDLTLAVGPG
jgi:hypothetical protein